MCAVSVMFVLAKSGVYVLWFELFGGLRCGVDDLVGCNCHILCC